MMIKILPSTKPATTRRRIVAIAYDRLCTFEFGIVAEIFGTNRPELNGDLYEFQTAAAEAGPLRAHGGLVVAVNGGLELLKGAGTVIIPGWRGPDFSVPQLLSLELAKAYLMGSRIVSICGGAYVLAAAGLLDGRRATTHWQHCEDFGRRFPGVTLEPNVLYVDDGNILSSAGGASGIDLCLHIVRQDYGSEVANEIARDLVVPPHRSGAQAQYVRRPMPVARSFDVAGLLDWMRTSLGESLALTRLSKRVGMTPRTFCRRFIEATGVAPGEWVINERLAHACMLLETTELSVDEVAYRAGLGQAPAMRHHFRKRLQTTPTLYREQSAASKAMIIGARSSSSWAYRADGAEAGLMKSSLIYKTAAASAGRRPVKPAPSSDLEA